MNCGETRTLVHGLLDHELDVVSEIALQAHLRECPACTAEYESHRACRALLKRGLPALPAPDRLVRDVRRLLRRSTHARPRMQNILLVFSAATSALAALVVVSWLLMPTLGFQFQTPFKAQEKYVYHVNSSENAATVLQNIAFHLEASPKAHFVVVTHNNGIDFLLRDAKENGGNPFEPRVATLAARGVEFRVCKNTLNVRHIPPAEVIALAQLVPSGIAEVGRLQTEEGYAYLKP